MKNTFILIAFVFLLLGPNANATSACPWWHFIKNFKIARQNRRAAKAAEEQAKLEGNIATALNLSGSGFTSPEESTIRRIIAHNSPELQRAFLYSGKASDRDDRDPKKNPGLPQGTQVIVFSVPGEAGLKLASITIPETNFHGQPNKYFPMQTALAFRLSADETAPASLHYASTAAVGEAGKWGAGWPANWEQALEKYGPHAATTKELQAAGFRKTGETYLREREFGLKDELKAMPANHDSTNAFTYVELWTGPQGQIKPVVTRVLVIDRGEAYSGSIEDYYFQQGKLTGTAAAPALNSSGLDIAKITRRKYVSTFHDIDNLHLVPGAP